ETYRHVEYMRSRCDEAGLPFIFLTPEMGYHSPTWRTLRGFYRANDTIGSPAFPAVCSIRLKIDPIYRFLEAWLSEKYGVQNGNKKGIRQFAATSGKIRVVLGITKGEESRVTDPGKSPKRWYRDSIEHVYPLIDLGMDRAACQDFLHARKLRVMPSNCMACHYASLPEIEFLRRFHSESLIDWANLEAAKLEKHKDRSAMIVTDRDGSPTYTKSGLVKTVNKNLGVFGTTPLTEKISEAKEKYKHWSDAQVVDYRYSHGHCAATRF
ncbi:hypothetical protein DOK_11856, partial [gamma proteobacterium BDW918]